MIGLGYLRFNPQFGGKLRAQHKSQYDRSDHWNGKQFVNQSPTTMDISLLSLPGLIREQLRNTGPRSPQAPIPILPFEPVRFSASPTQPKFVWYGHSVLLLQLNGKNILIDPMLGPDASPIAPFSARRFSENALAVIDQLPRLDAILMTHDHYDHLDYASFKQLRLKTDTYLVSLGVARHLERWGIPREQIREFDWWQETELGGVHLTFTPSRHFSGRGPFDRAQCLWGGWVFRTDTQQIYWSGDGGYGSHFQAIGAKFGSFDWAFLECGQYNERWHAIHLYPEEAVQVGKEVKAKLSIPVHWGGFSLALHPWKDPIERFVAEAARQQLAIATPRIGEIITLGAEPRDRFWWQELK